MTPDPERVAQAILAMPQGCGLRVRIHGGDYIAVFVHDHHHPRCEVMIEDNAQWAPSQGVLDRSDGGGFSQPCWDLAGRFNLYAVREWFSSVAMELERQR